MEFSGAKIHFSNKMAVFQLLFFSLQQCCKAYRPPPTISLCTSVPCLDFILTR